MKSLIELSKQIDEVISDFQTQKAENVFNEKKSAGLKARKLSLRLAGLLKDYRAESVKAAK